jgi:hypothetical protein
MPLSLIRSMGLGRVSEMGRKRVALKGQKSMIELHLVRWDDGPGIKTACEMWYLVSDRSMIAPIVEGWNGQWGAFIRDEYGRLQCVDCSRDYLPF